jgi:hypothetical protein
MSKEAEKLVERLKQILAGPPYSEAEVEAAIEGLDKIISELETLQINWSKEILRRRQ